MYQGLELSEVAQAYRLAVLAAAALAAVAVGVGVALGFATAGVAVAVGLGVGALNGLLLQRSTERFGIRGRRRSAFDTLARLGAVTLVVAAVIFVLGRPGFGAVFGVAIFQVVLLATVSRILLRELRRERSA